MPTLTCCDELRVRRKGGGIGRERKLSIGPIPCGAQWTLLLSQVPCLPSPSSFPRTLRSSWRKSNVFASAVCLWNGDSAIPEGEKMNREREEQGSAVAAPIDRLKANDRSKVALALCLFQSSPYGARSECRQRRRGRWSSTLRLGGGGRRGARAREFRKRR